AMGREPAFLTDRPTAHPHEPRARRGRCRSAQPGTESQTNRVPGRTARGTPRETRMRFIGLDLHKKTLVVCALDRRGNVVFRETVECRREALESFARTKLSKDDRLAVEATTSTWAVADILRPFVASVTVGNPLQIRAIAQAKVKTDKIDAEVLANLL